MRYIVVSIEITFFLLGFVVNRSRCTVLEPCGYDAGNLPIASEKNNMTNAWFKWGQLYSYCIQNYKRTHVNRTDYEECITVCKNPESDKKIEKCQAGCTSDACRDGCRFYDGLFTTENKTMVLHKEALPFINSTAVTAKRYRRIVTFDWGSVGSRKNQSLPSVYLVTKQARQDVSIPLDADDEYILGLVDTPTHNATWDDMCARCYGDYIYNLPNLAFRLQVYPINLNGPANLTESKRSNLNLKSEFISPIKTTPVRNFSIVGKPFFKSYMSANYIVWKLKLNESVLDDRSLGVRCRFNNVRCDDSDKEVKVLKKINQLYGSFKDETPTGYCEVGSRNTDADDLASCDVDVDVAVKYGKCYLSSTTHRIRYSGCKGVPNYPKGQCKEPEPPKLDTLVSHVNVTKLCECHNATAECPQDREECYRCSDLKYIFVVKWNASDIAYRINSFTVIWGEVTVIMRETGSKLLPRDATSYEIEATPKNDTMFKFGIQVHANTNYSEAGWKFLPPKYTKDLEARKPLCIITPLPQNHPHSDTSEIVIAVVLVVFLLAVSVVAFRYLRQRSALQKDNTSADVIMTPEQVVIVDEWEIDPKHIRKEEEIGEGAFGQVFSATIDLAVLSKSRFVKTCGGAKLLCERTKAAVKLLKEGSPEEEIKNFEEEITLMKGIGFHKNIVNMIGCSTIKAPLCLVVEFLPNGDLLQYLRKKRLQMAEEPPADGRKPTIGYDEVLTFSWQIACGMEYLASKNVVHRDLAARNILVGRDNLVKISDFGFSRQVCNEPIYVSNNQQRKLPLKWMSVEALYRKEFTTASDVWAYGVVLFEIVTFGGAPYPFIGPRELCKMLKSGYRMEKPDNCSTELYDIMCHCWNEVPDRRPDFTELREHLEKMMEQGDRYFSFEIDDSKDYYNVPSFGSIPSEDEEETLFTKEYHEKPIQVKPVVMATKDLCGAAVVELGDAVKYNTEDASEENETARYISPQSLKSFTDLQKTASFDNPNFHFNE